MPREREAKAPYIPTKFPWFPTKTDNSTRFLDREVFVGERLRTTLVVVHPYLKEYLPSEIYEQYRGQKIRVALDCSTPEFITACIERAFTDCYEVPYKKRFWLLSQVRDYLFRGDEPKFVTLEPKTDFESKFESLVQIRDQMFEGEGAKPRIVRPENRRKRHVKKNNS